MGGYLQLAGLLALLLLLPFPGNSPLQLLQLCPQLRLAVAVLGFLQTCAAGELLVWQVKH